MSERIISASAAPYDGHAREVALESIARCGFDHVEPAFIVGYTEPFDESAFLPVEMMAWRKALDDAGLKCHALSSHIDLGLADSVEVFTGRMAFAAGIGARVIATNAAARSRADSFFRNIDILLRRAAAFDVVIALENPGDGSDNLINTAEDGLDLVARLGSRSLALNYDAANTASHRPGLGNFAADAVKALPASAHAHIKDVRLSPEGWFFTPVGKGDIDCERLLEALQDYPDLPVSIELPLRLYRGPDAKPVRGTDPVPLKLIEAGLSASLSTVRAGLGLPVGEKKKLRSRR